MPLFPGSFSHTNERGQALLIVVLVMVVALTVGLSVATRSVVNLRISSEEANSQKAFSAAEAGVEEVLKTNVSIANPQPLGAGVIINTVNTQPVGGNNFLINSGTAIAQDDGADIWLSDYSTDPTKIYKNQWNGTMTVFWGTAADPCTDAALEILVIAGTVTEPIVNKYVYDPCSARANVNGFSSSVGAGGSVNAKNFKYSAAVTITPGNPGLVARVIPIYAGTTIGITANGATAFPVQGRLVTALGTAGSTQRKVVFFQGYDTLPSEFFYSLFSIQ